MKRWGNSTNCQKFVSLRIDTISISFPIAKADIINGSSTLQNSAEDLNHILDIFEDEIGGKATRKGPNPIFVIGNHCLEAGRSFLMQKLGFSSESAYYSIALPHRWKLIVLDTTEMSGHSGLPEDSWQCQEARTFQEMFKDQIQMSSWNGGITNRQMHWLKEQLNASKEAGEKVIIASHHQIAKGGARETHLAWNHKDIYDVVTGLDNFHLALAGHDHVGGYISSSSGTQHFITVEALLESPQESNAYGILRFFNDRIELVGEGTVTSRVMKIR